MKSNTAKIRREEADLNRILEALPDNPIPWVQVVTLVAPIIARLAVRYALKRIDKSMGEERVNTVGDSVATFIGDIIKRRLGAKQG